MRIASKPEQILDNIRIVGRTDFTAEELARINEIVGGYSKDALSYE